MSHYSDIGFHVTDTQGLYDLIDAVLPKTQQVGLFWVYRDPSGAELWLSINENHELCAAEPYFSGSLQKVWVGDVKPNSDMNQTGFANVWQNGSQADENRECVDGDYSYVLDIPDIDAFPESTIGTAQMINVCAFALNAEYFVDEAAYDASQADQELKFATKSFIPSGLFLGEDEPPRERPDAVALFTGIVCHAEKRINHFSGNPFYYCEIDTYGGRWSAVYPAEAFADTPQIGGVISGEYWITGRLANQSIPKKRSFW